MTPWEPDCRVFPADHYAVVVPSQRGLCTYLVEQTDTGWECECEDHFARGQRRSCKHVRAAIAWLKREGLLPQFEWAGTGVPPRQPHGMEVPRNEFSN